VLQGQSQGLTAIRTPGFAPHEQEVGGKQGPWTDIYACGATLYYLLSGHVPQPALERKLQDNLIPLQQLSATIPPGLSDAVMQALAVDWEYRPQDVRTFQALLTRDGPLPSISTTLPPTVASLIVTCPQCQVTNSVPAGSSPTEMQCAQCSAPLSPPTAANASVSTVSPSSVSALSSLSSVTSISAATFAAKGKSLAAIAAALVLFLGAGVWAKGYYNRVVAEAAAEEEAERRRVLLEKKQHEAIAKRLKQAQLALEQQQQQIEAEKQKLAAQQTEKEKIGLQQERARIEAERERQREARVRQRAAQRQRTEERFAREEYRPTPKPTPPPANNPNPLDSINKAMDVACKILGTCDARFR
jgi:ribosomal protein S27E